MESQKSSYRFLITYGSSGQSINREMCDEGSTGKIQVDQCYTLTQRDLKYTLLHLKQRAVRSTITSLMCRLDEKFSIKSSCVFGYSAVSIGSEIDEHPGMSLIVQNLNSRDSSSLLECWMAEGNVKDNKRGLLYQYLDGFAIESMNKAQLFNHVKTLNSMLAEAKAKISELESFELELEHLRQENRRLKLKLETQLFVFAKAGRLHELQP